ncbi:uncharacterized protein LOC124267247 [Haliotis rubra]|uniref:uncharacterized protein LOC124267247 n=1 Tax=Haliotis rubra TaxID=36100 RepID=UPI001EE55BE4|nr:uncharacterized protein LOC124267247 [Haliotis rubra]
MSRKSEKPSRKSLHPNLEIRGPTLPRLPPITRQKPCRYEEFKSEMSNFQDRLLGRPGALQRSENCRNKEISNLQEASRKRKSRGQMGQRGDHNVLDKSGYAPSPLNEQLVSMSCEDMSRRRYLSECRHRLAKKWQEQKQTMKEFQKKKEEELKELKTLLRKEKAVMRLKVNRPSVVIHEEKENNDRSLNKANISICPVPSLEPLKRKSRVCREVKKSAAVEISNGAGISVREHAWPVSIPEAQSKNGSNSRRQFGSKVVLPPIKSKISKQVWR